MTVLEHNIEKFLVSENNIGDRTSIPYYGGLPLSKNGKYIGDSELMYPNITEWYELMDTPIFKSDSGSIKGPEIYGEERKNIQVGPMIYDDPDNLYLFTLPMKKGEFGAVTDDIFGRLHSSLPSKDNDIYHHYRKGPLDSVRAHLYTGTKDGRSLGKWSLVHARHNYINPRDYNYTLDTTSDLQDFIRLLKYFPLAKIKPNDYPFWKHHMEGLVNLAYYHFMKIIHHGSWVARWEDLPSLTAVNDVQLNRLLRQPDDWLRSPAKYQITNISRRDHKFIYLSLYHYKSITPSGVPQNLKYRGGVMKLTKWRKPNNLDYSSGGMPNWSDFQVQHHDPIIKELLTDTTFYFPDELLYLPQSVVKYAKMAIKRAQDLLLANLQKSVAVQTAVEDEDEHKQHEDYTDPYENPFLVYNPRESEAAGRPVFQDVSLRPGKQNLSYTSNRYSLYTWKKVPDRLRKMIRVPDESGRLVKGGIPEEKKGNILPLLALGATGAYIYTQVKG